MQILLTPRLYFNFMQPIVSHPRLKSGVEARAYQLDAAKECLSGSTLLVMPTGLGKTAVQWMAMAENLEGDGKIVLVAPTIGLVSQQARMAEEFIDLEDGKIITLTGQIRPDKREILWKDAKIIMATPHVIRNDALSGRILLSEIDLLICDEAHHATGSNSMAQLGDLYLQASNHGKVLAATASPGVKASSVLEIIQRLGIERLHITKREDDIVKPYVTEMSIEEHRIVIPDSLLRIILPLKSLLEEEVEFLRRAGFLIYTGRVTSAALEEAQRRVSAAINRGDVRGFDAAKRISDLRRLTRLIDLLETQGLRCAIMYLDRARQDKDRKTKRFLSLAQVSEFYTTCKEMDELHPKPSIVEQLVFESLAEDGKVIIFTEYRDTVDNLIFSLKHENIKPGRFVGQASKGKQLGMKQSEQIEQLERFRDGEINVLVATSVGEEGLDVPAADCVVLYEPVPSAIRSIQRRGRTARKTDGAVKVLITQGTRDEYVQMAARNREIAMHKTLKTLRSQSRLPKRSTPKENVLANFSINGQTAEEFINLEFEKLATEKVNPEKQENNLETSSKKKKYTPLNRPQNQKSLAEFSANQKEDWWNPVLDGSKKNDRLDEIRIIKKTNLEIDDIDTRTGLSELIVLDNRESNSTLPALIKLNGHDIKFEHLRYGDIKISDRVLIERKSSRDFIDSIIDGRILKQAKGLFSSAIRPLLIVESMESDRIHPNAVMGAMAWITLDLGLPVLMTKSIEETARFVSVAAKREAKILKLLLDKFSVNKRDPELDSIRAASSEINSMINDSKNTGILFERWENDVKSKREKILSNLPGIGPKTAKSIMSHCNDIMGLCMLELEDLCNIEGVSSSQASELFRFLHG